MPFPSFLSFPCLSLFHLRWDFHWLLPDDDYGDERGSGGGDSSGGDGLVLLLRMR